MSHRFQIIIEGDAELTIKELWPDDDAPENPTAEDVRALMESSGRRDRVLRDWMLLDDLDVTVLDNATGKHVRVWDRFAPRVGLGDTEQNTERT